MLKNNIPFRFPENQRYAEDYYLWIDILLSGNICYKSDLKLVYLYKASYGESGLSSKLWKKVNLIILKLCIIKII